MPSNFKALAGAAGGGDLADPNFENVTLLLHGDGSNGAQNNTFIDSSTNNFTITRNGNTTQGSFSPYGSNWSNYFDGTGDYLDVPSSTAFALGTGDFTVEAWIFTDDTSFMLIASKTTGGFGLGYNVDFTGQGLWFGRVGQGPDATINTTLTLNQWNHIAVTRQSNSVRFFVNGTQVGSTQTVTTNYGTSAQELYVGRDVGGFYFTGYASNVRVVKGTAVYTANFTPSTTPLTAITNTSLLTCADNRFRDGSTNNFTITRNGDVKVTNFAPFAPSSAYSTTTNGGSAYFDGTGDYLNWTGTALGSGNFTVECWLYQLPYSTGNYAIIGSGASDTSAGWELYLEGASSLISFYSVFDRIMSSTTITPNQWFHLACVRNGSTITLYINGNSVGTVTLSSNFTNTTFYVANDMNLQTNKAYIADVRHVVGTAVYTANFTPPSSPLSAVTNTSALLKTTNAAIFDNSMKNDLETVGNAQISTSVKKFGTGSMYFDGNGDNLICNTSTTDHFAFGSGDFTIEFWLYLNSTSGLQIIYDGRPAGTSSTTCPTIYTTGQSLRYYVNGADRITGANLNTSTWYHIAVTRSGTSTKLFVDGTQSGSTYTDSVVYTNTASRPGIGFDANATNTNYLNGYLDELRVTKGVARYTANFTAPTAPFPNK